MPAADDPRFGDPIPLPETDLLIQQLEESWTAILAEMKPGDDEFPSGLNLFVGNKGFNATVIVYYLKRLELIRWVKARHKWTVKVRAKVKADKVRELIAAGDVPRAYKGRRRGDDGAAKAATDSTRINELEAEVAALRTENQELRSQLQAIRAVVSGSGP